MVLQSAVFCMTVFSIIFISCGGKLQVSGKEICCQLPRGMGKTAKYPDVRELSLAIFNLTRKAFPNQTFL